MKITREEMIHVAQLARLDMDEESAGRLVDQVGKILAYVDTLNKIDTTGVPPTSHAIDLTNAFRADEVKPHLDREKALANAPAVEDGCFIVPKIIG
jgi:aspartyl-tRNA(Asn)/glutamyl-tRNA(Gln) amidotransferase subunit C